MTQNVHKNRLTIDPVTRLEGHLKVTVELDNDRVKDAWVSTQLFRGLEPILKGRPPTDAPLFTQRACGVCTNTHCLTSIRAIEDALGIEAPPMAEMIRHLILSTLLVHDYMVHFYHLHGLDWIDMAAATTADPVAAGKIIAQTTGRSDDPSQLFIVQKKLKEFVASGQLGFLENAYFLGGNPAYKLSPEENLILSANYMEALRVQLLLGRAMALFAGKNPHAQTMVVGGVTCYNALNADIIGQFQQIRDTALEFVENAMVPDVIKLGKAFPEAGVYGWTPNFFAFEDFRDPNTGRDPYFNSGVVWKNDLGSSKKLDIGDIEEHVAHSWYVGSEAHKPYDGVTEPMYTSYDDMDKYSWTKAPRYQKEPMEVGPLGRRVVAYARGEKETVEYVKRVLGGAGLKPEQLSSTMGRTMCRVIETSMLINKMQMWIDELSERVAAGESKIYKDWKMRDGKGVGMTCVTRGELSHWIRIKDGKIDNYQMVVPSTWNFSPRCAENKIGAAEQSLINCPCPDPERPVEILRTVHSYDPCIACSVHLVDARGKEMLVVQDKK